MLHKARGFSGFADKLPPVWGMLPGMTCWDLELMERSDDIGPWVVVSKYQLSVSPASPLTSFWLDLFIGKWLRLAFGNE